VDDGCDQTPIDASYDSAAWSSPEANITMNTSIAEKSGDRSTTLVVEALEKGWKSYLAQLKRCRLEFSNEAVHDLRVATRRVIAIIQLLSTISPRPRLRKIIRTFKEQMDELDELRDTQVILAELSETLQEFPQLQRFRKRQHYFEEKHLKSLRKKIRKFQTSELTRRIRKVHEMLQEESPVALETPILQAVDDAYLFTRQRLSLVDPARPSTIHRVRIAFKNFRYMVEIVHPMLMDFPRERLKSMHDYQSVMGEVQDAEVFMQTLTDYSESASLHDLEAVRLYYERRHADAITAYVEGMNHLYSFWRTAPDQPFPWEMSK
jgi:CHAD domain-containing protein